MGYNGEFSRKCLSVYNVFSYLLEAEKTPGRLFSQRNICIDFIVRNYPLGVLDFDEIVEAFLSVDNVIEILLASVRRKNQPLKIACIDFMWKYKTVFCTKDWNSLRINHQNLALEVVGFLKKKEI